MKSKTRHVDGGGSNPPVHEEIHGEHKICEVAQIQQKHTNPNRSPKVGETPMKSKTRHVDGGGKNPQFETSRI